MPWSHFLSPPLAYVPLRWPPCPIIHVFCRVGMKDTPWIIACDSWERIWVVSWDYPRTPRTISRYEDRCREWTVTIHGSAYRHSDAEHDRTRERYFSRSDTFFRAWDTPVKASPILSEGKSGRVSHTRQRGEWRTRVDREDHGIVLVTRWYARFSRRLSHPRWCDRSEAVSLCTRGERRYQHSHSALYQGPENHSFRTEIILFFSHKTWKNTGIS